MKILKNRILQFIVTAIVFISVGVLASNISATDVVYKNNKSVSQVLDDLYGSVGGNIGQNYSSSDFGHQRLASMSTTIENLPSGKYLCTASYSAASAGNQNYEGSGDSSITFTGCDSSNVLKQNAIASGAANAHSNVYEITQHDIKIIECNVSNTNDVTATFTSASASNWIPWVLVLNCTSVE